MADYQLEIYKVGTTLKGVSCYMLLAKVVNDKRFAKGSNKEYIHISGDTDIAVAIKTDLSGNGKELGGLFPTDAFAQMVGARITFCTGSPFPESFNVNNIHDHIAPLAPGDASIPDATKAMLQTLLT